MSRAKQQILQNKAALANFGGYSDEDFDGAQGGDVFMDVAEEPEPILADTFDSAALDLDYSLFKGNFSHSLGKIHKNIAYKNATLKHERNIKKITPHHTFRSNLPPIIPVEHRAMLTGTKHLKKVIVPRDRELIVEGVDKFSIEKQVCDKTGYYKGKRLKELLIEIDNTQSAIDFNLELFNPSEPLDFLHSTSLNINSIITVGGEGSDISYTDTLFGILANPTMIVNARLTASAATSALEQSQLSQSLFFKNKNIAATEKIQPMALQLHKDLMQVAGEIVEFDIMCKLNRPFIIDGLDVVKYTVLAGCKVNFCFYYKQHSLKKFFFKEAKMSKKLI